MCVYVPLELGGISSDVQKCAAAMNDKETMQLFPGCRCLQMGIHWIQYKLGVIIVVQLAETEPILQIAGCALFVAFSGC